MGDFGPNDRRRIRAAVKLVEKNVLRTDDEPGYDRGKEAQLQPVLVISAVPDSLGYCDGFVQTHQSTTNTYTNLGPIKVGSLNAEKIQARQYLARRSGPDPNGAPVFLIDYCPSCGSSTYDCCNPPPPPPTCDAYCVADVLGTCLTGTVSSQMVIDPSQVSAGAGGDCSPFTALDTLCYVGLNGGFATWASLDYTDQTSTGGKNAPTWQLLLDTGTQVWTLYAAGQLVGTGIQTGGCNGTIAVVVSGWTWGGSNGCTINGFISITQVAVCPTTHPPPPPPPPPCPQVCPGCLTAPFYLTVDTSGFSIPGVTLQSSYLLAGVTYPPPGWVGANECAWFYQDDTITLSLVYDYVASTWRLGVATNTPNCVFTYVSAPGALCTGTQTVSTLRAPICPGTFTAPSSITITPGNSTGGGTGNCPGPNTPPTSACPGQQGYSTKQTNNTILQLSVNPGPAAGVGQLLTAVIYLVNPGSRITNVTGGWTLLTGAVDASGGNLTVWWKLSTAADLQFPRAAGTWTFNDSTHAKAGVLINHYNSTQIGPFSSNTGAAATSLPNVSISPSGNSEVFGVWLLNNNSSPNNTYVTLPAALTQLVAIGSGNSAPQLIIGNEDWAGGATGTLTATYPDVTDFAGILYSVLVPCGDCGAPGGGATGTGAAGGSVGSPAAGCVSDTCGSCGPNTLAPTLYVQIPGGTGTYNGMPIDLAGGFVSSYAGPSPCTWITPPNPQTGTAQLPSATITLTGSTWALSVLGIPTGMTGTQTGGCNGPIVFAYAAGTAGTTAFDLPGPVTVTQSGVCPGAGSGAGSAVGTDGTTTCGACAPGSNPLQFTIQFSTVTSTGTPTGGGLICQGCSAMNQLWTMTSTANGCEWTTSDYNTQLCQTCCQGCPGGVTWTLTYDSGSGDWQLKWMGYDVAYTIASGSFNCCTPTVLNINAGSDLNLYCAPPATITITPVGDCAGIFTPCYPAGLPTTIHCTITAGTGCAFAPLTVPLVYGADPSYSSWWSGTASVDGGPPSQILFTCAGGTDCTGFVLQIIDPGGSCLQTVSTLNPVGTCSDSPLSVDFSYTNVGSGGACCPGIAPDTANFTVF